MADIFISYSSKDRAQAEQLTELLASAGLSVWIDKSGIDVATSWSGEIVDAIEGCKAFVVLLSPNSVGSVNVVKEVSLAAEQKKRILPLDLEPVELPRDLKYHLAGLQRAPMTNIDAIIRAIGKLGLEATQAPTMKLVKETDSRKSLMILPFEDLSPTGDNGWFADGIVSELINALSNVKLLRLMDTQATKEFKTYKGQLPAYAATMQIRYFVQGDVRKFGDQIKISARLLDIETGDYLWKESIKGTMADVFEIQEQVAHEVVAGLRLHLTSEEEQKLTERGTANPEAYELYLKALEYLHRQTKESIQFALQLSTDAIAIDPVFAKAYQLKALALTALYRQYDREAAILDEAEALCKEALRLQPDLFTTYFPLMAIYVYRGNLVDAETVAKEYVRNAPQNFHSHFTLGYFYHSIGQTAMAIAPFEEAVRLQPGHLFSLWNLVAAYDRAGETEKRAQWAEVALPVIERKLKLNPDHETNRVEHAVFLFSAGRTEEAHAATIRLSDLRDGGSLYNMACLFSKLGDKPEAIRTLRKAIKAGFVHAELLTDFLTDEKSGIPRLAGTPEYQEVKRMVDKLQEEATTNG